MGGGEGPAENDYPPRHYLYGIHHIDICFEGRCTNKYLEMGIGYNIHLPNALY